MGVPREVGGAPFALPKGGGPGFPFPLVGRWAPGPAPIGVVLPICLQGRGAIYSMPAGWCVAILASTYKITSRNLKKNKIVDKNTKKKPTTRKKQQKPVRSPEKYWIRKINKNK